MFTITITETGVMITANYNYPLPQHGGPRVCVCVCVCVHVRLINAVPPSPLIIYWWVLHGCTLGANYNEPGPEALPLILIVSSSSYI